MRVNRAVLWLVCSTCVASPMFAQGTSVCTESASDLTSPDHRQRLVAIYRLRSSETDDPAVLRALIDIAMSDEYPRLRAAAIMTLGDIASEDAKVKDVVRTCLDDSSPCVRLAASKTLLKDGEAAIAAMALIELLGSRDSYVRAEAQSLLIENEVAATPLLLNAIEHHPSSTVRALAAESLGEVELDGKIASSLRVAAENDSDDAVRNRAIWSLGSTEASHDLVIWLFERLHKGDEEAVRLAMLRLGYSALKEFEDDPALPPAARVVIDEIKALEGSWNWSSWTTLNGIALQVGANASSLKPGDSLEVASRVVNVTSGRLVFCKNYTATSGRGFFFVVRHPDAEGGSRPLELIRRGTRTRYQLTTESFRVLGPSEIVTRTRQFPLVIGEHASSPVREACGNSPALLVNGGYVCVEPGDYSLWIVISDAVGSRDRLSAEMLHRFFHAEVWRGSELRSADVRFALVLP